MTNQEKLATLIGEGGQYLERRGCGGGHCEYAYPDSKHINREICTVCGSKWKSKYVTKPPSELIEIAEKSLFDAELLPLFEASRDIDLDVAWRAAWGNDACEQRSGRWFDGWGKTLDEARMACAIAGLERMKEEKDEQG